MTSDFDGAARRLLDGTDDLLAGLDQASDDLSRRVGARLRAGVKGPLRQAVVMEGAADGRGHGDETRLATGAMAGPANSGSDSATRLGDRLWELARVGTELRARHPDVAGLGEAAAVLQDLALGLVDRQARDGRANELTTLLAEEGRRIQAVPDGPYLVTNAENLNDHLGVPIPTRPLMALCRCGESAIKPTCDGICHGIDFSTAKDPNRVADRSDIYVGQSVTVLDNRGICQHSGLCTDRLASVFHILLVEDGGSLAWYSGTTAATVGTGGPNLR